MKIGIMQPYLFPYIGYFQLIHAVDTFVIYDDVNYIKQGWINRNRILLNGSDHMFTLQLKDASSFKKINEIEIGNNGKKVLKTIQQAYVKSPLFKQIFPLLQDIFLSETKNLADFVTAAIYRMTDYLGIEVGFCRSSELNISTDMKGEDRVLHICRQLESGRYINAIGGMDLYSRDRFEQNGIELKFLKSNPVVYKQFENEFIPWLSIIDVLAFNSRVQVKEFLNQCELI